MGLAIHGKVDGRELKRLGDRVRDDIAQLPGGELAELQGTLDEQVNIEVTEESLRRFGLSFADVANAIRQSSLNSSGGRIESSTGDVAITARQLADTEDQFNRIIIRQTTEQGTVRVEDVANVIDGFVSDKFSALYGGEPTAFVMIPPRTRWTLSNTLKASGLCGTGQRSQKRNPAPGSEDRHPLGRFRSLQRPYEPDHVICPAGRGAGVDRPPAVPSSDGGLLGDNRHHDRIRRRHPDPALSGCVLERPVDLCRAAGDRSDRG
jgi:hypothetical protein